jgi:hypothetical protein
MKKVGKMVGPDHQNRLRSIIQLYLKEVRGEAETENALTRAVHDGGLGLSDEQKQAVMNAIDGAKKSTEPRSEILFKITEKKKNTVPDLELAETVRAKKSVEPAIVPDRFPATTTPFNAFKHPTVKPAVKTPSAAPAPRVIAPGAQPVKKIPSKEFTDLLAAAAGSSPLQIHDLITPKKEFVASKPVRPAAPLTLSGTPEMKPLVRDVAAVTMEVGPVDELARFSLTDFRRLSPNATEAANRLKEKFLNLKEESVVLFLQALDAWQHSPLYMEYMGALTQGLVERRPLSAVLSDAKKIQVKEITALITMENELT